MNTSNNTEDLQNVLDDYLKDSSREPVLNRIFFYDSLERRREPFIEQSVPEITKAVWTKSYLIFEQELKSIVSAFTNHCNEAGVVIKPSPKYPEHMTDLFDLKMLDRFYFIILNNLSSMEFEKQVHKFKIRTNYDALETYIIGRNIVYLTFISLLEYVDSIENDYIFALNVLTFLLIYSNAKSLSHLKHNTDTIDYTVYEISTILQKDYQAIFHNLISDSVVNFDHKRANAAINDIIKILYGKNQVDDQKIAHEVVNVIEKMKVRDSSNNSKQTYQERSSLASDMNILELEENIQNHSDFNESNYSMMEKIISSKSDTLRFKSKLTKSQSSEQIMSLLLIDDQCLLEFFDQLKFSERIGFHIHSLNIEENLSSCNIGMDIEFLVYLITLPKIIERDIKFKLKTGEIRNASPNISEKIRPSQIKSLASYKIGLQLPRVQPRIIMDLSKTSIDRDNRILSDEDLTSHTLETFITPVQIKSIDVPNVVEIIDELVYRYLISEYRLIIYDDYMILFVKLNFDQEEKLLQDNLDQNIKGKMTKLLNNRNIVTVLLPY